MKKNLLIVEKNLAIRSLLKNVLCTEYKVAAHGDCFNAIHALNKDSDVNAIVLSIDDYYSPDFDLLVHLHSSIYYAHIPVIVLSANTSIEFKIKCLELRVEAFFLKPFDPLVLSEAVNDVIIMAENLSQMKDGYHYNTQAKQKLVG